MPTQKWRKQASNKSLLELEPLFLKVQTALIHDLASENIRRLYLVKERGSVPPLNEGCSPYLFKKIQQIVSFDKRIIWRTDKSFDDLSKEAFAAFEDDQKKFLCPEPMNRRETLVVQKASQICRDILGEFDYDCWLDSCSFGKRAAVGLKRRESYLDKRINKLSGTPMQISTFRHALSRDVHLFRAVRERTRSIGIVDAIKATSVPKSWKAARIIAPDTILGGFLSRGLGDMVRVRLEGRTHINLAEQQDRHRRWAKCASKTGHLATIDMSKASDSFVRRHVELLLPDSWLHPLDIVRCGVVTTPLDPNRKIEYRSLMLMGSGHTFPLQTLLFYSLAEATRVLLKIRGKVSVYGDDIIVPTIMASRFISVMSALGFRINSEKSFFDLSDPDRPSQTFFRESCGGDYKGGIDVRPFMPECDLQSIGKVPCEEYIAWCHKIINGLLERWDIVEIPLTVLRLFDEINSKKRKICLVPAWETSHAGIKHYIPPYYRQGYEFTDVEYVNSVLSYWRLTYKVRMRKRSTRERPYVWYAYWLKRRSALLSGTAMSDLYSSNIELSGESLKGVKGDFRFRKINEIRNGK
jgi:hypothetical protein